LRRKHVLLGITGGMLCAAAIGGYSIAAKSPRRVLRGDDAARPAAVVVVRRQPLSQSITLSGEFKPFQRSKRPVMSVSISSGAIPE